MANQMPPRVSVGLPVFNGENFISQTIASILAQTFTDFELIISDNASTDRTEAICRNYVAQDPRIRYYRNDRNLGAAANFNRVFALASSEYFKWAAHDDALAPEYLSECVKGLDDNPSAVLCQTLIQRIGPAGEALSIYDSHLTGTASARPSERFAALVLTIHLCTEVFGVIRREALNRTWLISAYGQADMTLLAELALVGPFVQIRQPLFLHRDHPGRFQQRFSGNRDEVLAWYGAKASARGLWSWWSYYCDLFRMVRRLRSRSERLRCYGHLLRWLSVNENFKCLACDALWALDPRTVAALRKLRKPYLVRGALPTQTLVSERDIGE
jgi:glycosyltransferase involved in cell wall biosynthesis